MFTGLPRLGCIKPFLHLARSLVSIQMCHYEDLLSIFHVVSPRARHHLSDQVDGVHSLAEYSLMKRTYNRYGTGALRDTRFRSERTQLLGMFVAQVSSTEFSRNFV